MSIGLGLAIAGVALAAALVAAAWIISRSFTGQPVVPQRPPRAAHAEEASEAEAIDTSRFTEAEQAEVEWIKEVLAKEGVSVADLSEARKQLDYYTRLAERRAQEA